MDGVDNDSVAVAVARSNVDENRVSDKVAISPATLQPASPEGMIW